MKISIYYLYFSFKSLKWLNQTTTIEDFEDFALRVWNAFAIYKLHNNCTANVFPFLLTSTYSFQKWWGDKCSICHFVSTFFFLFTFLLHQILFKLISNLLFNIFSFLSFCYTEFFLNLLGFCYLTSKAPRELRLSISLLWMNGFNNKLMQYTRMCSLNFSINRFFV